MEKINELFNHIKDRFSNPLIFSFTCSWLIINWHVTVALLWFNTGQIEKAGFTTIFDFIESKMKSDNFFWYPLLFAIAYTLIAPNVKNLIRAFYTWVSKWGDKWNLKIMDGGKISVDKYLSLREEYLKRSKILEDVISQESEHQTKYNSVNTELLDAKATNNELRQKFEEANTEHGEIKEERNTLTIKNSELEAQQKNLQEEIKRRDSIIIELKGKAINTIIPEDWRATTDRQLPQWATSNEINLNDRKLESVICKVSLKTDYLRFGFRLLSHGSSLFGQKGILNDDNTALVHISKALGDNSLSSTFYIKDKAIGDPIQLGDFKKGDLIYIEVVIDENDNLEYKVNGMLVWTTRVNPNLRERLYLLAWGDRNEYDMEIKDIVVTTVPF